MSSWSVLNIVLMIGCFVIITFVKYHSKENEGQQESSENILTDNVDD